MSYHVFEAIKNNSKLTAQTHIHDLIDAVAEENWDVVARTSDELGWIATAAITAEEIEQVLS